MDNVDDLPKEVQVQLGEFTEAARAAWKEDLSSVVLYGSAAEGRLRTTSDVNLLLVLRTFQRRQVDQVRDALRVARAAIRLGVMFLREDEIQHALEAFAVKFDDILSRHRILYGKDPFKSLAISRSSSILRVKQVLLNLELRLRERYALIGLQEEQLAFVIADFAGPLRACAATLLRIQGQTVENPKTALQQVVSRLNETRFNELLKLISEAREQGALDVEVAERVVFDMMDLVDRMQALVAGLS